MEKISLSPERASRAGGGGATPVVVGGEGGKNLGTLALQPAVTGRSRVQNGGEVMELGDRSLIENWSDISENLSPSTDLYPRDLPGDRSIAAWSLLSGRREYWAVAVCLVEYARQRKTTPRDILNSVPFEQIRGGEEVGDEALEFLRYCSTLGRTHLGTVTAAAYSIWLLDQAGWLPLNDLNSECEFYCLSATGGRQPAYSACLKRCQ